MISQINVRRDKHRKGGDVSGRVYGGENSYTESKKGGKILSG